MKSKPGTTMVLRMLVRMLATSRQFQSLSQVGHDGTHKTRIACEQLSGTKTYLILFKKTGLCRV